jgi:hypothetical protein
MHQYADIQGCQHMLEVLDAVVCEFTLNSHAVSRWVSRRHRSCKYPIAKRSGTRAGFLRVLQFPLQFSFHQLLHNHHLTFGAGTICQIVADAPSGLSLTPPHETNKAALNASSQILNQNIITIYITS